MYISSVCVSGHGRFEWSGWVHGKGGVNGNGHVSGHINLRGVM